MQRLRGGEVLLQGLLVLEIGWVVEGNIWCIYGLCDS